MCATHRKLHVCALHRNVVGVPSPRDVKSMHVTLDVSHLHVVGVCVKQGCCTCVGHTGMLEVCLHLEMLNVCMSPWMCYVPVITPHVRHLDVSRPGCFTTEPKSSGQQSCLKNRAQTQHCPDENRAPLLNLITPCQAGTIDLTGKSPMLPISTPQEIA